MLNAYECNAVPLHDLRVDRSCSFRRFHGHQLPQGKLRRLLILFAQPLTCSIEGERGCAREQLAALLAACTLITLPLHHRRDELFLARKQSCEYAGKSSVRAAVKNDQGTFHVGNTLL